MNLLGKYTILFIFLSVISSIVAGFSIDSTDENPRSYNDVKIFIISRMYDYIGINGYHNLNKGYGYDDSITLKDSNRIRLFGLLIIYNETGLIEFNHGGGWIHSRIEIFGYDGWMAGQNTGYHVIMFGDCETINIISYR